jgi:tRNA-uridine 2-sulfurtransferase
MLSKSEMKDPRDTTVVVAMSGGVDSGVAAALLHARGYKVIGVTMQIWQESATETKGAGCCSLGAVEDARRVASKIGIPHYCLNYREYFADKVIGNFVEEYKKGRTPNPCVNCNRYVKFDALLDQAKQLGAHYLATGHYARIEYDEDRRRWILRQAIDSRKDQTYALYHFTQEQLSSTMMPLGDLSSKDETRAIAYELGLSVAGKPDSQDICFVQGGSYTDFLAESAPETIRPGSIVDSSGRSRGVHDGIAFYTIGQRKRINVGSAVPLYVVDIDVSANTVVVGSDDDLKAVGLEADDCNWISESSIDSTLRVTAKVRYNMKAVSSVVSQGNASDSIKVAFDEPQRAVTPGQAVVMYQGDTVVGGATISKRLSSVALESHV